MGEDPNENVRGDEWGPGSPTEVPSRAESTPEVDTLKADIDQTRAEIGETLQAIEEKLAPGQLASDAAHAVKERASRTVEQVMNSAGEKASQLADQTRDAASVVADRVRDNPIPAALLGIGLGWLVYRAFSGRGDGYEYADLDDDWAGDAEWTTYEEGSGRGWGGGVLRSIADNPIPAALISIGIGWLASNARRGGTYQSRSTGGEWAGEPSEEWEEGGTRSGLRGGVRDWAQSARDVAHDARHRVGDMTSRTSQRLAQVTRRSQTQLSRMFQQNPLAFGVAAAAVGAAIGLSMPESERENAYLGQARESMMERAREAAGQSPEQPHG